MGGRTWKYWASSGPVLVSEPDANKIEPDQPVLSQTKETGHLMDLLILKPVQIFNLWRWNWTGFSQMFVWCWSTSILKIWAMFHLIEKLREFEKEETSWFIRFFCPRLYLAGFESENSGRIAEGRTDSPCYSWPSFRMDLAAVRVTVISLMSIFRQVRKSHCE